MRETEKNKPPLRGFDLSLASRAGTVCFPSHATGFAHAVGNGFFFSSQIEVEQVTRPYILSAPATHFFGQFCGSTLFQTPHGGGVAHLRGSGLLAGSHTKDEHATVPSKPPPLPPHPVLHLVGAVLIHAPQSGTFAHFLGVGLVFASQLEVEQVTIPSMPLALPQTLTQLTGSVLSQSPHFFVA